MWQTSCRLKLKSCFPFRVFTEGGGVLSAIWNKESRQNPCNIKFWTTHCNMSTAICQQALFRSNHTIKQIYLLKITHTKHTNGHCINSPVQNITPTLVQFQIKQQIPYIWIKSNNKFHKSELNQTTNSIHLNSIKQHKSEWNQTTNSINLNEIKQQIP